MLKTLFYTISKFLKSIILRKRKTQNNETTTTKSQQSNDDGDPNDKPGNPGGG